jgi:AcrR family transcriptional regulator
VVNVNTGTKTTGRPRDPQISQAITVAALRLLEERGFARMSIEAVASEAGVGKPAIYRRFRTKADVVASAIAEQLPSLEVPDLGDTKAESRLVLDRGLPADGNPYMGLIGGLLSEYQRHPELIEAFRDSVLLPRRAIGRQILERGQSRGDIRADLPPEMVLDALIGPFYARIIAGLDSGPRWRDLMFDMWWASVSTRPASG